MQVLKRMWPYLMAMILNFYGLPLLMRNTGSAMVLMLAVIPVICFICSVFYGVNNVFHPLYTMITILLFVPTIFIFYNISAWIYIIGYGVAALAGNVIGSRFYK